MLERFANIVIELETAAGQVAEESLHRLVLGNFSQMLDGRRCLDFFGFGATNIKVLESLDL